MPKETKESMFTKIDAYKKVINCITCGKRIQVFSLGRKFCDECGYKSNRGEDDGKRIRRTKTIFRTHII